MRLLLLAILCHGALVVNAARAHPVLKDQHHRTAVLRLEPTRAQIAYRVEVDVFTALVDLHRAQHPGSGRLTADEVPAVYTRFLAQRLPELLELDHGETSVNLRLLAQTHRLTDHLRCEYLLEARWPTGENGHTVTLREKGWDRDDASRIALYLDASSAVTLLAAEIPDADLIARRPDDWQPGDGERRRTLRATFTEQPREPPGRYRASLPPEAEPEKPTGTGAMAREQPSTGENRATPGWAGTKVEALQFPQEPTPAEKKSPGTLRALLLDSSLGFGTLLLLAGLFGAAHALTPGHGKTMVAAYLVGERGTLGHAVLLGVVTTLTHTAAVLLLAAVLPWLIGKEQQVQSALEFLGGLLIAVLGVFLLLRRVLGQSDHVHLFGDHSHGPVPADGTTVRWGDLILLGVAGGIVPCWDAIAMLAAAIVLGQLWLALPLLLAFSAGLAFVLVAIGISVVLAKKVARPHLERHRYTLDVLGKVLPLVTAILITVLGLWLCWEALHGGHSDINAP